MKRAHGLSLRGAVPLSHFFLRERVRPGDAVVDATCGNGQDTLLLAQLVGPEGQVWGFDLQPKAVEATAALLAQHGVEKQATLLVAGHERLAELVAGPLAAAVFNLGYLPGGDTSLVTSPESSVAALDQAARLLTPGGIVTVAVYTGHPGGPEEAAAVAAWGAALSPRDFNVWCHRQMNRPETAPYLVFVEKIR